MSNKQNDTWLEEARSDLEEACQLGDWPMARAVIADIEEQGFNAEPARRYMNLEMAKVEDVTYEPYEHPTPPTIKPSEMDEPVTNTFQSDFVTEYGDDGELHHSRV